MMPRPLAAEQAIADLVVDPLRRMPEKTRIRKAKKVLAGERAAIRRRERRASGR